MPVAAAWVAAAAALSRQRIGEGLLVEPSVDEVDAIVAVRSAAAAGHAGAGAAPPHRDVAHLATVASSIFRQQYTAFVTESTRLHRSTANRRRYVAEFEGGDSIVAIAARARFPPFLMARLLLEELCGARGERREVTLLMRNLDLVPDAVLRRGVEEAVAADRYFGPAVDRTRAAIGAAHEELLCAALAARGLPFVSEEGLRAFGAPQTPDGRLDVPIGVVDARGRAHVVHWIDSKAAFGDADGHAANLRQLQGYVNREGPGAVVYWFDFDAALFAATPPDVAVLDHLPGEYALPGAGGGAGSGVVSAAPVRAIPAAEIAAAVAAAAAAGAGSQSGRAPA